MKGSPLLRTLLIAVVVAVVGVMLQKHMGQKSDLAPNLPSGVAPAGPAAKEAARWPFELVLSAPAKRVMLRCGDETMIDGATVASDIRGDLPAEKGVIFLEIDWTEGVGMPRYFAKLRVEPHGRESVEHVFDAAGNMNDLWEMP